MTLLTAAFHSQQWGLPAIYASIGLACDGARACTTCPCFQMGLPGPTLGVIAPSVGLVIRKLGPSESNCGRLFAVGGFRDSFLTLAGGVSFALFYLLFFAFFYFKGSLRRFWDFKTFRCGVMRQLWARKT